MGSEMCIRDRVIDGTTVLPLTSYSFMNVDSNHTLYVTFREK